MKWQNGRQEATKFLRKLTLWSFWRTDGYILKIPKDSVIDWHVDVVKRGPNPKHFRLNITLWGNWSLGRKFIDKPGEYFTKQRIFNFHLFRPDIIKHSATFKKNTYILSIGFVF